MNKIIILVVMVLAVVTFSGCRSALVNVEVVPKDANLIANGTLYEGGSPYIVEASTGRQLVLRSYKEGYQTKNYIIDYSLSTLGVVEACTAIFVLPAIGLAFDNAWKLDENNVKLELELLEDELPLEEEEVVERVEDFEIVTTEQ